MVKSLGGAGAGAVAAAGGSGGAALRLGGTHANERDIADAGRAMTNPSRLRRTGLMVVLCIVLICAAAAAVLLVVNSRLKQASGKAPALNTTVPPTEVPTPPPAGGSSRPTPARITAAPTAAPSTGQPTSPTPQPTPAALSVAAVKRTSTVVTTNCECIFFACNTCYYVDSFSMTLSNPAAPPGVNRTVSSVTTTFSSSTRVESESTWAVSSSDGLIAAGSNVTFLFPRGAISTKSKDLKDAVTTCSPSTAALISFDVLLSFYSGPSQELFDVALPCST